MKWLNSLDELLYEVVSWLVFFPITIWRTLARPLSMMDYADRQLALPEDQQYAEAVSPPLFLVLTLALSHGLSVALGEADAMVANDRGLGAMISDDQSALVLRALLFALFPLVNAVLLVRARRLPLDRTSLRMPFYAQCYPAAVFALGLGLGTALAIARWGPGKLIGLAISIVAIVYYVATGTRWYRVQLGCWRIAAFGRALAGTLLTFLLFLLIGALFVL